MPKNKSRFQHKEVVAVNALELKEDGQEYAKVTKMLGNGRVSAICNDGKTRLCIIPGRFRKKKIWINADDVILLNIRDYQDNKADIIHRYTSNEAKKLLTIKELDRIIFAPGEDGGIEFESESEAFPIIPKDLNEI